MQSPDEPCRLWVEVGQLPVANPAAIPEQPCLIVVLDYGLQLIAPVDPPMVTISLMSATVRGASPSNMLRMLRMLRSS
jgi:hypothetical protein